MDRLFSKAQKKRMYVLNGGLCAKCGGLLGESWHAHHVVRYADGGVTELTNGEPLCEGCHRLIHRKIQMVRPREWQETALQKFMGQREPFLLEATPGAGKTIFSGLCAQTLLADSTIDFAVIVVPTTAVKGDGSSGFLGDWNKCGVQITTQLKDGKDRPRAVQGAVITYAQLPNIASTFEVWAKRGERLLFVFDEIHHLTEQNIWGQAGEKCGAIAERVLGMTGTPFRGDGLRISFVRYNDENKSIADYQYSYRQAVGDRVCREVQFIADDGVAEWILNENDYSARISEANSDDLSKVSAVIFDNNAEFVEKVLIKAQQKLDEYRRQDPDAGGLIICRPGETEWDEKHLSLIAKRVKRVLGEVPVVVSGADGESDLKIERFRSGEDRWLCAVRKVSEGVDIKRLRVLVLLNRPTTELLFRQMVGRVVRHENQDRNEDATVFMAKFDGLWKWANRISEEAEEGLKKRQEREAGIENGDPFVFLRRGDRHEDGMMVTDYGETFTAAEVRFAERFKSGDPELVSLSVGKIAHILKKAGCEPAENLSDPEPEHIVRLKLRKQINKTVKQIAYQVSPNDPGACIRQVWTMMQKEAGVGGIDDLMDNHSIEKMEQTLSFLQSHLARVK